MQFEQLHRIFFIGIGGIGMSALARYFQHLGKEVFGYDRTETSLTQALVAEGMSVHYEDRLDLIPQGVDLVIYTPAIPKDHQQYNHLLASGIPMYKRAQVLGMISQNRRCLAVAGTHGKTTTSSLLTHLLRTGGVDCTAFLGGISVNLGGNFVQGNSEWVVVEADEFDRSFLHLHPEYAIVTSMDPDHLDIYSDAQTLYDTYQQFARQVKHKVFHEGGLDLGQGLQAQALPYGLKTSSLYRAANIRTEAPYVLFDFYGPEGLVYRDLRYAMPGEHNIENATAAMAIALELGVSEEALRQGLMDFKGIQRRFEWVYRGERGVFIDDYAHHPTELQAAIRATKALYPNKRILGVFQPHLYSRTRDFYQGFAQALDELDEVILLPIYPARELPMPGVESEMIFSIMKSQNKELIDKKDLLEHLKNRNIEVLLTLGAGDIGAMIPKLKVELFESLATKD